MTQDEQEQLARPFLSVLFPGSMTISRIAHRVDGVIARAQTIAAHGVKVEIMRTVVGHDGVALTLHNTAERGGRVLDEYLAAVFSFRGDRIGRLDTYLSDVPMAEAFFGWARLSGYGGH
jgi:uncharacterized protein